VQYHISPETISAICDVFAQGVYPGTSSADKDATSRADGSTSAPTRTCEVGKPESETSFATLASNFVNALAAGSPMDLGKDWLLHRLHCILVEHQPLTPGEIEVMRADIRARAKTSHFSLTEAELLTGGIERTLVVSHG
jgi:hypothetical protein